MPGFKCPHNEDVHVFNKCCIVECPYHMVRVKELFDVKEGDTGCAFYDTDLMQNVSVNRTQISALSRDPRRLLSPKLMRSTYETAVEQAKTLHSLTHSVSVSNCSCKKCGYPLQKGFQCVSTDICNTRKEWVKFICSQYNVEPAITKYQMIWELLFKNEISSNETTLKTGLMLCSKRHIENNPNIPKSLLDVS